MRKNVIIAIVIIFAIAAIAVAAVILSRDSATGTISLINGGHEAASVGEASGNVGGSGTAAEDQGADTAGGDASDQAGNADGQKQLNIFTYDKELEVIIAQYAKTHPEFNYKIVSREIDPDFFYDLNHSLQNHDCGKVDLYCLPAAYAQWYIKGDYSRYACTYKELGIDVEAGLKKADIPQSIIDAGTRPDGELIALPYKKNVNLFIYRRSIAKEIWGTDDPDRIAEIIGAGTGKWDKFLEAARRVKKHGAYMLANPLELAVLIETGISSELLSDDIYLDPKWEEFTDISKYLLDNDLSGYFTIWSDEYVKALDGAGDRPVFGFITNDQTHRELSYLFKNTPGDWAACLPSVSVDTGFQPGFSEMDYYTGIMVNKDSPNKEALGPLIEWITLDSSETGLQYSLANDTFYTHIGSDVSKRYTGKRAVISGTVMKNTINSDAFLGGQNINTVIHDAHLAPTGKQYYPGMDLFRNWYYRTGDFLRGDIDKKTAVAEYRKYAREERSTQKDMFESEGLSYSADGRLYSLVGRKELNVYSYDQMLIDLIEEYAQRHPEFNYKINRYYSPEDELYPLQLINERMQSGSKDIVDIYCVPDVYSHEIIKGEFSRHACAYRELGIDVDAALKKADIPQHIIDAGKNPDSEIIALPYMAGVNVFMYRRSIARDVWGTDDPDKIAGIIGAGTDKWDKFLEAAQTLKEHGCYVVPGFTNLSFMIDSSPAASLMKPDDDREINPKWLEFMDVSKNMLDKGYMKRMQYWSEEWRNALNGKGDKPVFGFIVPYEYICYLLKGDLKSTAGDWAICLPPFNTRISNFTGILVNKDSPNKDALGPLIEWLTLDISESGLQYGLANDTLIEKNSSKYGYLSGKWPVISGTILKNSNNSIDYLGGQNVNPVICDAMEKQTGKYNNWGSGSSFFYRWNEQMDAYLAGEKDREAAVADYKEDERKMIRRLEESLESHGISFLLP